jgi:hypothetical protein
VKGVARVRAEAQKAVALLSRHVDSLKQPAPTVTETHEGEYATPTCPSIDDDLTDGDENNPAVMSFKFSPSPRPAVGSLTAVR